MLCSPFPPRDRSTSSLFAIYCVAYDGAEVGSGMHHLRSAGGAVEHPLRQRAHVGVATLAGVFAQCVRKGDYLLKRP
jgi:hypothetical protein